MERETALAGRVREEVPEARWHIPMVSSRHVASIVPYGHASRSRDWRGRVIRESHTTDSVTRSDSLQIFIHDM